MPVVRTYRLELNDNDPCRAYCQKAAVLFEQAAQALRKEMAGGDVVSHGAEVYETADGSFRYVPESTPIPRTPLCPSTQNSL